jgi:hypothetical protein
MPATNPPPCSYSAMFQRVKVVLLNIGNYPATLSNPMQLWKWDGTNWSLTATVNPPPRANAVFTIDEIGNLVLFGGENVNLQLSDTWTYNGATWTQQSPATSPTARAKANAAGSSGAGTIMFGGTNSYFMLDDTYFWDGYNWYPQNLTTYPQARTGHSMAASSSKILLFGGQNTNSLMNDTWIFVGGNGGSWTQVSPLTSPSVRTGASMSYDPVNSIWIMFGGINYNNYLIDTWIFNGTNWSKAITGSTNP